MISYEELNEAQEVSENDPFTLDRYRQFFRHFPSHAKTVLDVGCNTGRGGRIFKELNENLNLLGLDCVKSRLDKIDSEIYAQKICSYSTDISLKNSSVDVVVAGEFIEHIYPTDVIQTIREFHRILKLGGRLLLTTPNPNYLKLRLTGGSVLGGAHVSQHYPGDLQKQLKENGFTSVKILGSGKMSRLFGENFPFLTLYGSYLVAADKTK